STLVGRGLEQSQHIADKRAQDIADTRIGLQSEGERSEPERSNPIRVSARASILSEAEAAAFVIAQFSDEDRTKIHPPYAATHGLEPDVIAHKSFPYVAAHALSGDLAVAFDPTPLPRLGIAPRRDPLGQAPAVAAKQLHWPLHPQRLVRSL